jgi:hypothetical protein
MAVDGTYDIEMTTQMGKQTSKLTLKSSGNVLSGSMASSRGTVNLDGGKVDGNNVAWSVNIAGPMGQMKLDYSGKVEGDNISGTVKLGQYGTAPFTGKRAT